jgi:hypothetical protein
MSGKFFNAKGHHQQMMVASYMDQEDTLTRNVEHVLSGRELCDCIEPP